MDQAVKSSTRARRTTDVVASLRDTPEESPTICTQTAVSGPELGEENRSTYEASSFFSSNSSPERTRIGRKEQSQIMPRPDNVVCNQDYSLSPLRAAATCLLRVFSASMMLGPSCALIVILTSGTHFVHDSINFAWSFARPSSL